MAGEKFLAKFEVKPTAIPDRIRKDFENVKHPSAIKLIPVAKNLENLQENKSFRALTMLELNEFVKDPFWMKVRWTLLLLSIVLFLVLLIVSILIILLTPACAVETIVNNDYTEEKNLNYFSYN